jgi:hypothetical protein
MRMIGRVRPFAWALAAVLGAVVVIAGLAGESRAVALGLVVLLAFAAWLAWGQGARRALVGGLYVLAQLDLPAGFGDARDDLVPDTLVVNAVPGVLVPLAVWWLARRVLIERRPPSFGRFDVVLAAAALAAWLRAMATPSDAHALALAGACLIALLAACVASRVLEAPDDLRFVVHAAGIGAIVEAVRFAARGSDVMVDAPALAATAPAAFLSAATVIVPVAFALVLPGRRRVSPRMWGSALAVGFTAWALAGLALSPAAAIACAAGVAVSALGWASWRWHRESSPWRFWNDPGAFALATGCAGALAGHAVFLALDGLHVDGRLVLPFLVAGTWHAVWTVERRRRAAESGWLAAIATAPRRAARPNVARAAHAADAAAAPDAGDAVDGSTFAPGDAMR